MGMKIPSTSMSQVNGAGAFQKQRDNFNQLAQALQSGNLSAAQQAFSTLSANSPNATNPNSPIAKLGQALQSGDVNAAQQAFSAMRSGHHHHSQSTSTTSPPLATTGSVGTTLNTTA